MLLAATSCFRGYGLHKIFELVAQSGYDGVDLVLSGSEYDTQDASYLEHIEKLTGKRAYVEPAILPLHTRAVSFALALATTGTNDHMPEASGLHQ